MKTLVLSAALFQILIAVPKTFPVNQEIEYWKIEHERDSKTMCAVINSNQNLRACAIRLDTI